MTGLGLTRSRHLLRMGAATLALTVFSAGAASAQGATEVSDPPALQQRRAVAPSAPSVASLQAPPAPTPNEQVLDLNIEYVAGSIYNPATGRDDKVNLRSYTQPGVPSNGLYISPAIHTRPGQVLRVKLNNKLPADASCTGGTHDEVNTPHCFNGTNLHTHGLWVNPAGNGDNVLLSINPGTAFEYEYAIPSEHPAGTFWYHTHRHGSTALQVSSGMAGALIIHGDRKPTTSQWGDLDTLLHGVRERTLVLQQIQYYCGEDIEGNVNYDCAPGQTGVIESYDAFGPGSWGASGRYTSINGLVLPDFRAKQGEIERWRIIHGGVRDTIGLQFRKAKGNPAFKPGKALAAAAMEKLIARTCTNEVLPMHLAAADGLTMAAAQRSEVATFQPGYRFDALVAFPSAGDYCVIDVDSEASGSVGEGLPPGSRLLGMVRVDPGTPVRGDIGAWLTNQLVAAANRTMPDDVKPTVIADLKGGLKLSRFVPHPDVGPGEVTGTQDLTFLIDVTNPAAGVKFEVGSQDYPPRPYDPARLDRKLTLGGVDEWKLQSHFVSHPFHIHVNPFQIISILDPDGRDVSRPDIVDDYALRASPKGKIDPQYRGLKGVWKDTLWIKSLIGEVKSLPAGTSGIYKVTIRTRYQRYIGEYVLHCHILDHEDQGMMQNVAVVLPGGAPASVNAQQTQTGSH